MKKAVYSLLMTLTVVTALVACKKDDGGGSASDPNATYATTPNQNCNIPGNANCTPSTYQQASPVFVNYQWSNANGFCGCPVGYRPVMNSQWGISCAPDNWFPNTNYYYGYNYNSVVYYSQNTQWTSIPQVTYSPATSGYAAGNCYATAAASCDIRMNSDSYGHNAQCGAGTCRSTSGGSYVGLCTYGYGNETYSNPQSCYRYVGYYGWVNICYGNSGYNGGGFYNGGTGLLPR